MMLVFGRVRQRGGWIRILVLSVFTCIPKRLVNNVIMISYPQNVVTSPARGDTVVGVLHFAEWGGICLSLRAKSSKIEKSTIGRVPYVNEIPCGISLHMVAIYSENEVGSKTNPCLKSPVMENRSERAFWWHTLPAMPTWRERTRMISSTGHPNLAHIAGLLVIRPW